MLSVGPVPVSEIKQAMDKLDPPVSWRTVERAAEEMNLIVIIDPTDARKRLWALPIDTEAAVAEAERRKVELATVPNTFPRGWANSYAGEEEHGDDRDEQHRADNDERNGE